MSPIPTTINAAPTEIPGPANERGKAYHYCVVMKNGIPAPPQVDRGMLLSPFPLISDRSRGLMDG